MVSLTLMLVIATISASIQQVEEYEEQSLFEQRSIFIFQSLPATPYFKMIDIWLFFSMNLMVGSNHRQSKSSLVLLGCMPDLPHLSGICGPNSGEERKEVAYLRLERCLYKTKPTTQNCCIRCCRPPCAKIYV